MFYPRRRLRPREIASFRSTPLFVSCTIGSDLHRGVLSSRRAERRKQQLLEQLGQIEEKLGIQQPEDWFTVAMTDVYDLGMPKRRVPNTAKLIELLQERFPEHSWDKMGVMKGRFGLQRRLELAVTSLFPGLEILTNARKEAGMRNPETGKLLEFDVYVPAIRLAFEYQERHHYLKDTSYTNNTLEEIKARDQLKQELAHQNGITLIIVPCWWDNKIESLASSIRERRKDLVGLLNRVPHAAPIKDEPPNGFFAKHLKAIEDIGEPINPCFFVHSQTDPTNWWVFEKYDGVRGFWNPLKKAMFSRTGVKFDIPREVIDDMPQDLFLDGELWFGRDNFQESMKIAHRMDHDKIHWNSFRFMVFDIPTSKGSYSERYQQLRAHFEGKTHRFITVAPYTMCKGTDHLEKLFQDIMDQGGEGIILRDPFSPYQAGRSSGFLKHKKYRDAEARIVTQVSPTTWECELPNGVRFVAPAGTTEFAKRWNPQPGDIVSFKHRGFYLIL